MKIAGHDGILSFKNKRLEITLITCKSLHILQFYRPIDDTVFEASATPDLLLGKNYNMQFDNVFDLH